MAVSSWEDEIRHQQKTRMLLLALKWSPYFMSLFLTERFSCHIPSHVSFFLPLMHTSYTNLVQRWQSRPNGDGSSSPKVHTRYFARFVTVCTIYLYNLKNVKNTHGGMLLLVKLQVKACNFTKSNTSSWVFFIFFKLCKWYQIVQSVSYLKYQNIKSLLSNPTYFRSVLP